MQKKFQPSYQDLIGPSFFFAALFFHLFLTFFYSFFNSVFFLSLSISFGRLKTFQNKQVQDYLFRYLGTWNQDRKKSGQTKVVHLEPGRTTHVTQICTSFFLLHVSEHMHGSSFNLPKPSKQPNDLMRLGNQLTHGFCLGIDPVKSDQTKVFGLELEGRKSGINLFSFYDVEPHRRRKSI
jgi:hypothetical protein